VGALAALAAEYLRRDEADLGIPYARRLLDVLPQSVAPHTLLGRLLAMKGEITEGIVELEKAREIDPDDPQPHIALASLYAKAGRPQDAAKERAAFSRINAGEKK
jgi:Flp pilus assembly protein TadD